jgi:hypothetical protein
LVSIVVVLLSLADSPWRSPKRNQANQGLLGTNRKATIAKKYIKEQFLERRLSSYALERMVLAFPGAH